MYGIDATFEGTVVGRIDDAPRQGGALQVLNFTLKVSGRNPNDTTYCRVGIIGDMAVRLAQQIGPGMQLRVRGFLTLSQWTDGQGQPQSRLSVRASDVQILSPSPASWGNAQPQQFQQF